jgi:uncharacterized protein YjbI with pentapeptide repeats
MEYRKYDETHNENFAIELSSAGLQNICLGFPRGSLVDIPVYETMDLSGVNLRNASFSNLRLSDVRFPNAMMGMTDIYCTEGNSVNCYN